MTSKTFTEVCDQYPDEKCESGQKLTVLHEHTDVDSDDLSQRPQAKSPISVDKIKTDAKQRERDQPLLQRLVKSIRSTDRTFRELVINTEPFERRVALLENGILEKFEIERKGEDRQVGAIFKGKIQNLQGGLKAAFVDIGQAKNTFIHYWDMLPSSMDSSIEVVRNNTKEAEGSAHSKTLSVKDIPDRYPIGTPIVVQITKDQIGTKGPRVTSNLSIAGRFLVLMPMSSECGISRKIEDIKERKRLKKVLHSLTIPEGMGVIVRTAGEGKKMRYFIRDLHLLLQKWQEVEANIQAQDHPGCVYREPDLIERTVRDFLTEEVDRVLVDSHEDYQRILHYVSQISSRSRSKITHFQEDIPIFERFNIEKQIEQTFHRHVPLPSGGEIVIHETEALTTVDVNTLKHRPKNDRDSKNYVFDVNLEATHQAARQIRLRDIGGLVVIDFVDMKSSEDRRRIYKEMVNELDKDKAKSHVLPISHLGIMQISRQRHKESHSSEMYESCLYCSGEGMVKSARTISVEIQRRLVSILRHMKQRSKQERTGGDTPKLSRLKVVLHPSVLERLRTEDESYLVEIQDLYHAKLTFAPDPTYHKENFKVWDLDTGNLLR